MILKDIVLISILASIVFVLEQVLVFIPNVQLTFLLFVVFSKVLKTKKTLLIILIHVLLDNLFMSSFNLMFIPFTLLSYSLIPILLNTVFIKIEDEVKLAFISICFTIIYGLMFVVPNFFLLNINPIDYIIADIPFTIILSISTFISIIWLYQPIKNNLNKLIEKTN